MPAWSGAPLIWHRRSSRLPLVAVLACAAWNCGDPASPIPSEARSGGAGTYHATLGGASDVIPNEYVVMLRREVSDVPGTAKRLVDELRGDLQYTYSSALRGFAARVPSQAIDGLSRNPLVELVEPNRVMRADEAESNPPSWGLDRIDQSALPLNASYAYNATGSGVNVYIIDSGIRLTHREIAGRAFAAFSAIADGLGSDDCAGHGTHVAGTVGGATVGVAKGAALYAVRVLDCNNGGSLAGVIAGLDWVAANRTLPAVANLSLGGGISSILNQAVANTVAAGVTVAVAAGNMAMDACYYSPASEPSALTVGATDQFDAQASYSNFGKCLDLFAPGSGITSLGIDSDSAYRIKSGTSMATPHVAGAAALYLQSNPTASPSQVANALTASATTRVLSGIDRTSPNLLLYVGSIVAAPPPTGPAPDPSPGTDAPPTASFSVSCSRWRCTFDASSSTDDKGIVSYAWNFGDGLSSLATSVSKTTHTYLTTGMFTVTVTVVDAAGHSSQAQQTVRVRKI
jgi:subtilisin family serine protease